MDEFLEEAYRRTRATVAVPSSSPSSAPTNSLAGAAGAVATHRAPTLPRVSQLAAARSTLPQPGSEEASLAGCGERATLDHLLGDLAPALTGQNRTGRYYGFVTGSALPVAEAADNIVSAYDQNVQVHLPAQTIVTEVEDAALRMLIRLLHLEYGVGDDEGPYPAAATARCWPGRIFTTGATASNILGLTCGREAVIRARLPADLKSAGVGELGLLGACAHAGIRQIQVLTSMGHSSLSKAASIAGLGRGSVRELPYSAAQPWRLDLDAVERELQRGDEHGIANIIAISAGEVNTGCFATTGAADMCRLRDLADRYRAWIHVDGAFGIFARALPQPSGDDDEFAVPRRHAAGLELADSITIDGHKLLNVPYDCGMFLARDLDIVTGVCRNPNAAYLAAPPATSGPGGEGPLYHLLLPSPLNMGLENSRRFRALPAYAVLRSEGRARIATMLARMVRLARGIAAAVRASPDYELLPEAEDDEKREGESEADHDDVVARTHVIVLFRARDDVLTDVLVDTINRDGAWYVSGTSWRGRKAVRVAVASWRVDVEPDLEAVKRSLEQIARDHRAKSQ
jgi:glutamate/tyrosine decarboxylase-like PLP-dependent enzyme